MSVNLGPQRKGGQHICELSLSDHNIHPKDLMQQQGFIYKSVWNYCSSSPCPSGYRCQTGFTDKRYRCTGILYFDNAS
ncbi:unnamed protein product [Porites evermanni]|uniref:Uncharacterized protein n=1 Tax=Porites evermanni TaxID=104178 RepID=A0ABN8LM05_9CNID|nr:unnamed protein product [Porites evermanni]